MKRMKNTMEIIKDAMIILHEACEKDASMDCCDCPFDEYCSAIYYAKGITPNDKEFIKFD